MKTEETLEDKRPDYKPRRFELLWQSYLYWNELMQLRKGHLLRLSSIERGKSGMNADFEQKAIESLDELLKGAQKDLTTEAETAGTIYEWLISIKGIGDHTAAKLIALFDDPAKFSTISKWWRYAGFAVINGEREYKKKGEKLHYNARLKSECFLVAEQFVRQQTPGYADYYYEQKAKDREKHPKVVCKKCETQFKPELKKCPECEQTNEKYSLLYCDAHLDSRAKRKTIKLFLSHFWLRWRELEGLEVTEPYSIRVLGHSGYIKPFNSEQKEK